MSKPLATKVSTPLSENVQMWPKVSIFCVWPPLFSSTALTLLGMEFTRASQVATGVLFHFSMTTSRNWWMFETLRSSTLRLRMPHITHTFISQTQPLDMTLSTCTQLLWSTMARPVLSGTCPVKLLYGLGPHAAAQFQGLSNLIIAYANFM